GLVLPARILLDELAIPNLLPIADAGRIAGERRAVRAKTVVGRALGGEAHRHVWVALARGEAITHAQNEEVDDARSRLRHLAAADLGTDPGAGGVGHLELNRRVARQRHNFPARPAACLLRRRQPAAIDGLGILEPLQPDQNRMALRIEVVGPLTAGITVACPIP